MHTSSLASPRPAQSAERGNYAPHPIVDDTTHATEKYTARPGTILAFFGGLEGRYLFYRPSTTAKEIPLAEEWPEVGRRGGAITAFRPNQLYATPSGKRNV